VWSARYRAWGRLLRRSTKTASQAQAQAQAHQPLRFQGQYEDTETGLYYNRYRYYDPDSGRYVSQDPIGLLGGLNAYQYAPNPAGWVDPLGLAKKRGGCDAAPRKEQVIETQSFEQARNLALQKLGPIVPGSRATQIGRLGIGKDQNVGFHGIGLDGTYKRYRLDYDPTKGPHINIEVDKGPCAEKYAIKFPGNEDTVRTLYRRNQ
jgi:RHS repeat-associated protein